MQHTPKEKHFPIFPRFLGTQTTSKHLPFKGNKKTGLKSDLDSKEVKTHKILIVQFLDLEDFKSNFFATRRILVHFLHNAFNWITLQRKTLIQLFFVTHITTFKLQNLLFHAL